jgi:hypothetical protein
MKFREIATRQLSSFLFLKHNSRARKEEKRETNYIFLRPLPLLLRMWLFYLIPSSQRSPGMRFRAHFAAALRQQLAEPLWSC